MPKAIIPTIRSRLALLVMACIVPAALMVAGLMLYNYRQGRAQLIRDSIATARAMMSTVDRELSSTQAALSGLATSPHLASGELAAFHAQATGMLKSYRVLNIVLLDPRQTQLVNTLRPLGSKMPTGVVPGLERAIKAGRPFISDIFVGPLANRHLLAVGVPVFQDGTATRALAAGVYPDRLLELLREQRFPPDWIAVIFDSSGHIVARTHQMEKFLGKKGAPAVLARILEVAEGSLETESVEGIPILSVFSRSAVSGWTVAIGIPVSGLTDELARTLWWLAAGTAILLSGSLALAWVIGGGISRPIDALAAPALALGSGEAVNVPSLPLKEADEVGKALTKASGMLVSAQQKLVETNSRLRESEERFRLAIEAAPSGLLMMGKEGRIELVNEKARRLFGYRQGEMLGMNLEQLIPERLRAGHASHRAGFAAAPQARSMGVGRDLHALRKDGTEVPVEIGLSPIRTADGLLVLSAIVDITERKRQMEAVERSNIELQRFAYVASHDLQTPLRSISGFVQLLRSEYAGRLDERADDWIRRTVQSIKDLQTLIRDLLDYARIDSQANPFESIPFRSICDSAVVLLDASIREAGALVTFGELPAIMGDRSQLTQLMLNLIGNAVKFRSAERPPQVRVSAERSKGEWVFSVRDNGIGIARKHYERIFEPFRRLHEQHEYPGTGIGLAVCVRVVHRHGGRIWVESEPGQGSTFRFTLAGRAESTS